jgi:hypothetical protein
MPQVVVTLILTGSAVAALGVTCYAIRSGRLVAPWDASTAFIIAIAWLLLASSVYTQLTGGTVTYVNSFGETMSITDGRSSQVTQFSGYAIAVVGLLTFIIGAVRGRRIFSPLLLAGLLVVLTDVSSAVVGDSSLGNPRIIALVAVFLGASVLPRGGGARLGIAMVGLSVAVASGLLLLIDFDAAFRTCRADKCGPLGNLFFGVTTGENSLGLILAATVPAVFLAFRGATRWILGFYMVGVIYLGGSRGALQSALIVALLLVLTRVSSTSRMNSWPAIIAVGTAAAGLIVGAVLPYLPLDPSTFTNRAHLWSIAQAQLTDREALGYGALHWGNQVAEGLITRDQAYSVHNQWLDIRYTAGWVGVTVFVVLICMALRQSSKGSVAATALLFIPVIYGGFLERTWAFGLLDVFGWMAAATLLALEPASNSSVLNRQSESPSLALAPQPLHSFRS